MNSSARPVPMLHARQAAALSEAERRIEHARARAPGERMHRSLRHLSVRRRSFAFTVLGAALLTAVLWRGGPGLLAAWDQVVLWWAHALGIPLELLHEGLGRRWVYLPDAEGLLPGPGTGVLTAIAVIAGFASTWWMEDRFTPLKYLVRTVCIVQLSALLFFVFVPSRFAYTAEAHLQAMLDSGYTLMLSLPLLLALGYGVLDLPLRRKLRDPLLVVAYFAVALPHKAVLHMLALQHGSVLFMPLLYLCFGLVFDIMLFVALYSFLVSRAPARAAG